MKRKKTTQEKHFIYVQVMTHKKTGLKNTEIARLLNISPAQVTRIINDNYYKELQTLDNIKLSDMSLEVSRSVFVLQADVLRLAHTLVQKTMEGGDKDEIDMLIRSLNCLGRFCQYSFNSEVK